MDTKMVNGMIAQMNDCDDEAVLRTLIEQSKFFGEPRLGDAARARLEAIGFKPDQTDNRSE